MQQQQYAKYVEVKKKINISDSMQRDFTMHEHYKVKQITLALCVMCSIFRRY